MLIVGVFIGVVIGVIVMGLMAVNSYSKGYCDCGVEFFKVLKGIDKVRDMQDLKKVKNQIELSKAKKILTRYGAWPL